MGKCKWRTALQIIPKKLNGTYEIILEPKEDERGFFMRTYDHDIFAQYHMNQHWVQENHSKSTKKGTIRGLHFQFPPFAENKLVRVIRGSVFDVCVDLRKKSSTFGRWDYIELSESNKKMIFLPRGFAHGFCTLTDECELLYKVDNCYNQKAEGGIIWNDDYININWPINDPILSRKDSMLTTFKGFQILHGGLESL